MMKQLKRKLNIILILIIAIVLFSTFCYAATDAELKNYTFDQVKQYLDQNGIEGVKKLSDDVVETWKEIVKSNTNLTGNKLESAQYFKYMNMLNEREIGDPVYSEIKDEVNLGKPDASGSHTVDEIIGEGNSFIDSGKSQPSKIDNANLKKASDTLYNILLSLGIVIAVAVGVYLGAKFMMASTGEKAQVKESLVPYIAGCVVVFGAFIIWKLAIMLFGQIG